MRIVDLWRYPVKSVGGERLERADVTPIGIVGDRGWGLRDEATGTILTARRQPELLFASARVTGPDDVAITLPDGTETADSAVLSDWLGKPVTLVRADPDSGGTYEAPLDFEHDAQWVSWQGPGGAWHDSAKSRLSLVSTTTLRHWDRRRFRANVVLDGDGEDQLVGQQVQLGAITLDVQKQIDRCVMVTRPQPGLERDLDVLRTINQERATFLAVGALVTTPGPIAIGDELTPL